MATKLFRCLLSGVLILAFLTSPAMADETFIDFQTDAGLLTEQFPTDDILTGAEDNATMNKGVFSTQGTAWLYSVVSDSRVVATGTVTVTIKLRVVGDADANSADLCMFIADAASPSDFVQACFDGLDHPLTGILTPDAGSPTTLGINLPGASDDYTLVYDPSMDKATLSRANNPISVSLTSVLIGATSFNVGLFSTAGPIQLQRFTATGTGIPKYPGDLIMSNPWVDFSRKSSGTGAQNSPFKFLSEGLAVASDDATISLVPGTDSTETPTVNQDVTLANSDFASGSVSIGVSARRDAEEDLSTGGFISRGASVRRK